MARAQPEAARRPARPWLVLALGGIGALLLVAVLGGLALRWIGARDRQAELLAIEAAGKAVLPEDLARDPDAGPDPAPLIAALAQAANAAPDWLPEWLGDPAQYRAAREAAQQGTGGADVEAAFRALDACAGADAPLAMARVASVLEARDGVVDVPPCGVEAARLALAADARLVALARTAHEYGPIDARAILRQLDAAQLAVPELPVPVLVSTARALRLAVLEASWRGDAAEVLDLLAVERDMCRVAEGAPLILGNMAWGYQLGALLDSLEIALPRLPRDSDLSGLEAWLTGLRPRAALASALEHERAFGNRAYEFVRRGDGPEQPGVFTTLLLSYDQARYLRDVQARIDRLGFAAYRRPPLEEPSWLARRTAPISMLLGLPPSVERAADQLEARLVLARVALVAFRADAKAALELVAQTSDPFDGRPVRCAMGQDGLVVLWSVGADRVDDGGTDDEKDLTWRLVLR